MCHSEWRLTEGINSFTEESSYDLDLRRKKKKTRSSTYELIVSVRTGFVGTKPVQMPRALCSKGPHTLRTSG